MPEEIPTLIYRVLLVDDTPGIHEDYRKVLSQDLESVRNLQQAQMALFGDGATTIITPSFELDSAYQGPEALQAVLAARQSHRPYALAFLDMRMPPGWDGLETAQRLWEVSPDLQIVLCTAYSDYSWEEMTERLGTTDRLVILMKPFENLEVLQLAHSLTEKWRLLQEAREQKAVLEYRVAERTAELQAAKNQLQTEMMDRSLTEDAFRQAQKMEAVGQLAGGLAHDFNNLLSVVRGFTGLLLMDERFDAYTIEALREVDGAAERASNLTRQLLTFSRKQVMQLEDLDINEAVRKVAKLLQCIVGETVTLELAIDGSPLWVRADRAMMEQVLVNLTVNARDAMPRGGGLWVGTGFLEMTEETARNHPQARKGRFVCLSVEDTGCGIAPEHLDRLYEPFFTTKEVGKGTGLGLATVYGIVSQHEGWLEVHSEVGVGTKFRICLPELLAAHEHAAPQQVFAAERGQETILLVEDEPAVRKAAQAALQRYGYRVYTAESGLAALSLWPQHADEIDLVLTDMVMPGGVSGTELGARLQEEKAALKVIYSSGYSLQLADKKGVLKEGLNFLPKPYGPSKLASVVRACLDAGAPKGKPSLGLPSESGLS